MTRNIYLLRHAQSADKQSGQTDKDRVLTAQGESDAKKLGTFLKKSDIRFDRIISSTARRAQSTTLLVCQSLGYETNTIIWDDHLYATSGVQIVQRVIHQENSLKNILIVGHNPAISEAAELLSCEDSIYLVPATLVQIAFLGDWSSVEHPNGQLMKILEPGQVPSS